VRHWVGCVRTGTIDGLRLRQLGLFAAEGTIFVVVVVADVLKLCGGAGTAPKAGCVDKGLFNVVSVREVLFERNWTDLLFETVVGTRGTE
jgi:hypothetical protein